MTKQKLLYTTFEVQNISRDKSGIQGMNVWYNNKFLKIPENIKKGDNVKIMYIEKSGKLFWQKIKVIDNQKECSGGQTISDNVGSSRNSMHGKVLASSETSAYGLQATSERGDYKTGSNMETTGDVRLKSAKVVSLLNDGTPRSSNPSDDNHNVKPDWAKDNSKELYGKCEDSGYEIYLQRKSQLDSTTRNCILLCAKDYFLAGKSNSLEEAVKKIKEIRENL